jgi:hypothetical protein
VHTEDSIVARLKGQARPAGGAVGGGSAPGQVSTGAGMSAAMAQILSGRAAGWAQRRSPAPISAAGISLALGLCAAAWFTAGTRAGDVNGALALCGCYLAGRAAAQGASAGWLARICLAAAEYAVYAGLAVGAGVPGEGGAWELAVTLIVLLAVRQTMSGCRGVPGRGAGDRGIVDRAAGVILAMPAEGRVSLVAVAAPAWGPGATLLGLIVWAIAVMVYAIAGNQGGRAPAGERAGHGLAALVACRDDGMLARCIGRLVRGQIVPLPAALAGLAAASALAVLGLRNLPGLIALAPLVVMLLAAPGSSHRHDGPFDWLVPAVLQGGQYVYIAALGFASGVAGPLIFSLCATIAIRSAAAAAGEADTGMGWEGRMLAAGLGAVLGLATLTYLALSVYLGVLICRKALTYLVPAEGSRR